jgi:hypothetical protein
MAKLDTSDDRRESARNPVPMKRPTLLTMAGPSGIH